MAEPRLYLRGRVWWTWFIDANGTRHQISTKCRDRKAARERALLLEREVAANSGRKPKDRLTVIEALRDMLGAQVQAGRSESTQRTSHYHARHLVHVLGADTPVDALTLAETTAYASTRLEEGASKHTVHKEITALIQSLKGAARRGLWDPRRDPKWLRPDLGKVYVPRSRWLTREEFAKLSAALTAERRDYLTAWCYLGLRKSELFDIRPEDYDAKRGVLRVRGTKTDEAERAVPVRSPVVAEVLARRCARPVPFPFWDKTSRDLESACVRAGIPRVSPNDLRRTFASWLIQADVPERVVAELLGHEGTSMVRSVYGHLDVASMAAAVERL